jgi:Na+-transporting methylmalonyl-CoA/oxaloacetate decarboxylase gamma subunit
MYSGIEGAFKIAFISIILVFFILSLLAALVMGVQKIINLASKKTSKAERVLPLKNETKITKNTVLKNSNQKSINPDDILVAVITASLVNYLEGNIKQVKILNIKRVSSDYISPWVVSGLQNRIFNKISISPRKEGGL